MDLETKIQLYLMGYEDGQKEAWSEIKRLIKKHQGWDLQSRIQSKLGTLYQDIDFKRAELMDDPSMLDIEEEEEEAQEPPQEEPDTEWEAGVSYLILEEKPSVAVEAMRSLMGDEEILFITSEFPKNLIKTYGIPGDNIFFIQLTTSGYNTISSPDIKYTKSSPSNLSSLSTKTGEFLKGKSNSIVVVHGVQDLVLRNQFNSTLKFIKWVLDNVRKQEGTIILSIDPMTLEQTESAQLKGYFDKVIEG